MTFTRQVEPEMMDDPALAESEHRRALRGLARLNRISGVCSAMYRRLLPYARAARGRPLRVLDVASGRADVPIGWATRARRDRLPIQITTIDVSSFAIDEQRSAADSAGIELRAIQRDCLRDPLPSGFDVVTCSLFMHHLDDHQVIRLLQNMQSAAGRAMIVCDLERTRLNLCLVGAVARGVSRSVVVHHDAIASVRGAYTRDEFRELAEAALLRPVECHRLVPCRFIMTVDELVVPIRVPAFA